MDAVNIQTKFGLGEIVTTHQRRKGNQIIHDQIGEATGSASGFRLTASDPNWRRKCR